jgi:small subunit ribosomal protein S6
MVRYEALVLTVPEITQDEIKRLETDFDSIIKTAKAATISFDKWGKHRLSYPIEKNDYGIYFLARFETEQASFPVLEELKNLFAVRFNDVVMRHMIVALDKNQSLEYERPLSVEEAPAKEANPFVKDRMDSRGGFQKGGRDLDNDDESIEEEA